MDRTTRSPFPRRRTTPPRSLTRVPSTTRHQVDRTSSGLKGRSERDGIARAVIGAKVMAGGRQVTPAGLLCRLILEPVIGRQALELPLHRIDPGDIGCNEMIAAPLAGPHLKVAARESCGGTPAAKMDKRGEILLLLPARRHIGNAGENRRDIAGQ